MPSDPRLWCDWSELPGRIDHRDILLYGRSEDWVHKALRRLPRTPIGIVDRDPAYHGSNYRGLPVYPVENVSSLLDYFIVITAGEFDGIVDTLMERGLVPGRDFVCSPDFRDYSNLVALRDCASQLLVSSSDYRDTTRARSSKLGGGLYLLDVATSSLTCVLEGSTRQTVRLPESMLAVIDYVSRRLLVLDQAFNILMRIDLQFANACGIAFHPASGLIYVANAGRDTVTAYDLATGARVKILSFGLGPEGNGGHHLNDLAIEGDTLFASYFSWSGAFKLGVFDGGVACWSLGGREREPTQLLRDLWKPHSPAVIQGELHVLDSMRGTLRTGRPTAKAKLNAFVRGIDQIGTSLAVGQSEDMYITERGQADATTVVATAGVNLMRFDENRITLARFIATPALMNIHDVKIWD